MVRLIVDDIADSKSGHHDIKLLVAPPTITDIFERVLGTEAWKPIDGADCSVYIKAPKETVEKIKKVIYS